MSIVFPPSYVLSLHVVAMFALLGCARSEPPRDPSIPGSSSSAPHYDPLPPPSPGDSRTADLRPEREPPASTPVEGWSCFDNSAFKDMSLCFRYLDQCDWARENYRQIFDRAGVKYSPSACMPAPSPLYCLNYRYDEEYRAFICSKTHDSAQFFWDNLTAFEHMSPVFPFEHYAPRSK